MSDIILIVPEKYQSHEQFVTLIARLRILGLYDPYADDSVKRILTIDPNYEDDKQRLRAIQESYNFILDRCVLWSRFDQNTKQVIMRAPQKVADKGWYTVHDAISRTLQIKTKVDRAKSK
jgi:hypothetical protein